MSARADQRQQQVGWKEDLKQGTEPYSNSSAVGMQGIAALPVVTAPAAVAVAPCGAAVATIQEVMFSSCTGPYSRDC